MTLTYLRLFQNFFIFLLLLPGFSSLTWANDATLSSLIDRPSGAVETGSGGIGPQTPNLLETSSTNSAATAPFLRPGLVSDFIYSDLSRGYGAGGFFPIPWGVMGFHYNYFDVTGAPNAHLVRLSIAREYSPRLSLGIQFKSYFIQDPSRNIFGFMAEPGIMFHLPRYRLNFFSRLKNLKISGEPWAFTPRPALSTGAELIFLKEKVVQSWLLFELYPELTLTEFPGALSLGAAFGFFQIRLGAAGLLTPTEEISYSGAIGFNHGSGINRISLQYGLRYQPGAQEELRHHISLGGVIDFQDTTPPEVTVTPQNHVFSPNSDGRLDEIRFQVQVKEPDPVSDWRFDIYDSQGNIVRSWSKDQRIKVDEYNPARIFVDSFTRREYRYMPAEFVWDGRFNSLDLSEELPPQKSPAQTHQGVYRYSLVVTDISGNTSKPVTGEFEIDNKRPEVHLQKTRAYYILKPGSQNKNFQIIQRFLAEKNDLVTGVIEDLSGATIKTFQWSVQEAPYRFKWRGEDDNGNMVKPGNYRYRVEVRDPAGNKSTDQSNVFGIYRQENFLHLHLNHERFSPGDDDEFDTLLIELMTPKWKNISNRHIEIYHLIPGTLEKKVIRSWKNTHNPQKERIIEWDGKDNLGNLASEGRYFLEARLQGTDSTEIITARREITLDISPPEIRVLTPGIKFTPDDDGTKDDFTFSLHSFDPSGVKACSIRIHEIYDTQNGSKAQRPYRQWTFPGDCPEEVVWDGTDWAGYKATSQSRFLYEIELIDNLMNRAIAHTGVIQTGVLVEKRADHYRIRMSMLDFTPGEIAPNGPTLQRFEEVILTLKNYPEYQIKIESHTGNRGDEESNLKLSEKRAKYIRNYLLGKGFQANNIAYQGLGEIRPVREKSDPYFARINERFEFILIAR